MTRCRFQFISSGDVQIVADIKFVFGSGRRERQQI